MLVSSNLLQFRPPASPCGFAWRINVKLLTGRKGSDRRENQSWGASPRLEYLPATCPSCLAMAGGSLLLRHCPTDGRRGGVGVRVMECWPALVRLVWYRLVPFEYFRNYLFSSEHDKSGLGQAIMVFKESKARILWIVFCNGTATKSPSHQEYYIIF